MWGRRPLVPMAAGLTAGIWGADRFGEVLFFPLMLLSMVILMFVFREKLSEENEIQAGFPEFAGFLKLLLIFILFMAVGTLVFLWEDGKIRQLPAHEDKIVQIQGLVSGVRPTDSTIRIEMNINEL